MERRLVCQGNFITTCCSEIGFDSSRTEQIADFSQCRLLLEKMDLCQNCQMLCYGKDVGWRINMESAVFATYVSARIREHSSDPLNHGCHGRACLRIHNVVCYCIARCLIPVDDHELCAVLFRNDRHLGSGLDYKGRSDDDKKVTSG